jgi:hypothetical protein
MFEERAETHKEGLTERIEPQLGKGERVQAVAVAQVGMPPWLQTPPLLVGIVLIVISLIVGALPSWVGIAGALLVLVGIATMAMVPRRLLARTNRSVLVFELPRSQRAAIEAPRANVGLAELPSLTGASVRLAGERLWANYGSGIERDAMAEVLAPE